MHGDEERSTRRMKSPLPPHHTTQSCDAFKPYSTFSHVYGNADVSTENKCNQTQPKYFQLHCA